MTYVIFQAKSPRELCLHKLHKNMKKTILLRSLAALGVGLASLLPAQSLQAQTGGAIFTPGPTLMRGKLFPTATLLDNGKVISFSGRETGFVSCLYSDLYDPATNTFTENAMNFVHDGSATVKLSDGRYLLLGGAADLGVAPGYNHTEMYDPATGAFTAKATMTMARCNLTAVQLNGGKVLVAGAWYNTSGAQQPEIYDTATNAFTATTGTLVYPRSNAMVFPTNDGGAVVAGGYDTYGAGSISGVEYYDPATGNFSSQSTQLIPADSGWTLSWVNTRPIDDCRMSNGKYLMLGYKNVNGPEYGLIQFDPATKQFSKLTTASPLRDSLTDGGFADVVLNRTDNMAYLIGFDSGYDPQRVCVVTVNLSTGDIHHPTTTFTLPSSEYFYASYTYMPASKKIMVMGINGGNAGYFTGTNKTYFLTPQIVLSVGEQANEAMGLKCYPNPSQGRLTAAFSAPESGRARLSLTDLMGRTLLRDNRNVHSGEQVQWPVLTGALPDGLYRLSIELGGQRTGQSVLLQH
jgi:hypothetical protein